MYILISNIEILNFEMKDCSFILKLIYSFIVIFDRLTTA